MNQKSWSRGPDQSRQVVAIAASNMGAAAAASEAELALLNKAMHKAVQF